MMLVQNRSAQVYLELTTNFHFHAGRGTSPCLQALDSTLNPVGFWDLLMEKTAVIKFMLTEYGTQRMIFKYIKVKKIQL